MLESLEHYYRSKGILATDFRCPHQKACSGASETFTGPKSAFVSTGYERGDLPRLLFLSLDSGYGDPSAHDRLPHAVRHKNENRDVTQLKERSHWYRTHELAWHILRQFDSRLTIQGSNRYFAHANSAKCCQNKDGKKQADSRLFSNCRRYLAGEIRLLRPDVIVSQGKWAKVGIQHVAEVIDQIDDFSSIIRFDERILFWLHTYHPGARNGEFDNQRDECRGWEKYSRNIKDFLDGIDHRNSSE